MAEALHIDQDEYLDLVDIKKRYEKLQIRENFYKFKINAINAKKNKLSTSLDNRKGSHLEITDKFAINYDAYELEQYQFNLELLNNTMKIEKAIEEYLTGKFQLIENACFEPTIVKTIEKRYADKVIPLLLERLQLEKRQKVDIIRHKKIPFQYIFGNDKNVKEVPKNIVFLQTIIELDAKDLDLRGVEQNQHLTNLSIKTRDDYNNFADSAKKIEDIFTDKYMEETKRLLEQAPFELIRPADVLARTPTQLADKIEQYYMQKETEEKSKSR